MAQRDLEQAGEARVERIAPVVAAVPAALDLSSPSFGSAAVLALQRTAGNAAVSALVSRRAPSSVLQRCACGGIAGPDGECAECKRRRTGDGSTLSRSPLATDRRLLQRNGNPPATAEAAPAAIVTAVRGDDVPGVVTALRGRSADELRAIREAVNGRIGTTLELWLARRRSAAEARRMIGSALSGLAGVTPGLGPLAAVGGSLLGGSRGDATATAEQGLRILWPVLPLIDKLLVYDEGWREVEQAQIDVIRSASTADRAIARTDPRLGRILGLMDPREEFEARLLIDPSQDGRYTAAEELLRRAPGVFSDEEDAVFDAILELAPARRRTFFDAHFMALYRLLSAGRYNLLRTMCQGTEAQALIARLRQATEDRSDDMEAVQRVVDRAAELLQERQMLRAAVGAHNLPARERADIEARLRELDDLDELLRFRRDAGGELAGGSFMGMLSEARGDAGAFGADASRLGAFLTGSDARRHALEAAKQRILLSGGDVRAIQQAIMNLRVPREDAGSAGARSTPGTTTPRGSETAAGSGASGQRFAEEDRRLREELMRDEQVAAVIRGLTGFERSLVGDVVTADAFSETTARLAEAQNGGRWGEFFRLIYVIARNDDWRDRFRGTAADPFGIYARTHGRQREIMETILGQRRVPIEAILAFTGDVQALKSALIDVGEAERAKLRLGATLAMNPSQGPPTPEQAEALNAYREFERQLRASQTTLGVHFDAAGFHEVLWTVLGSEPTAEELQTDEGRFRAAELMYQQQQQQLRLERGASAELTETDEVMVAAAREFASRFEPLRERRRITSIDFAALSTLHDRFLNRGREFGEASDMIGEMAGMVAATVAGIVVVAATGGTATPAVIAAAAAAGGGARVVTQEMFGADYYDPEARDALLGAVDGALAVVGGSLAARATEMVGLSGRALAVAAARTAGEVAEHATQPLARRVAAGAVQSALDGAFSGAVSQAFGTMTDPVTWRRGVWRGLVRTGEATLAAGLTGLASGGLVGGGTPVLGAAGRRVWGAIAGQSLESSLSAGARETLDSARRAAQAGRADEMNRLLGELEAHVTPEQMRILRQQLGAELTSALGHPPGRATPTEAEARVLAETAAIPDGRRLTPEQLEVETNVVSRSDPQPSAHERFVDEVDLGNEHTWRRKPDETWCRFSAESLCGTRIRGARPMDPELRARTLAAEAGLERLRTDIEGARQLAEQYPDVLRKLQSTPRPDGRVNLAVLSDEEREILENVFPDRDVETLLLREAVAGRSIPGRELGQLYSAEERAILELRDASRPLYDKCRAASPSQRVRDRVISRSGGVDEFSRLPPPSGQLAVDHIIPLREIVDMPGFSRLDWADQVAILNDEVNLAAVDRRLNSSRGDWPYGEWPGRNAYPPEALARALERERTARARILAMIEQRAGAGVP